MSASAAQLAANQANAQLSTGPTTAAGLAASKLNALKHGLTSSQVVLKSEDPAAYQALRDGFIQTYAPANEVEAMLVEQLSVSWWKLQRAQRIETRLMQELGEDACFLDDTASRKWNNFVRHRNAVERAWKHALSELKKCLALRQQNEANQRTRQAFQQIAQSRAQSHSADASTQNTRPSLVPDTDRFQPRR